MCNSLSIPSRCLPQGIPDLSDRMDRQRIGVGGHSFGAVTTQLIAGTTPRLPGAGSSVADARVKAFVALHRMAQDHSFLKTPLRKSRSPSCSFPETMIRDATESRLYGDGTLSTMLAKVKNIWSGSRRAFTTSAASREPHPH